MWELWTDGGARGNPGPAGIGVVLKDPNGTVHEISKGIGWATNNVAEYVGLIEGMRLASALGAKKIHVRMDSLLVVQQMKGAFKVKHAGLKPLHAEAQALKGSFDEIEFEAIPREDNSQADRLMNEGIDRWLLDNPDFEPPVDPAPTLF